MEDEINSYGILVFFMNILWLLLIVVFVLIYIINNIYVINVLFFFSKFNVDLFFIIIIIKCCVFIMYNILFFVCFVLIMI